MKRVFSIILSLIIISSSLCGLDFSAYAANSPYYFSSSQQGTLLTNSTSYFSKKRGLSRSKSKKSGKKLEFGRYKKLSVLGKEKKDGDYFYVKVYMDNKPFYGYVKRHNVVIKNDKNFKTNYVKKDNPYYDKSVVYKFYKYKDMPFYQFNQTGKSGRYINGLSVSYSCGPHTIATVLSALNGGVIYPETIMSHMSRASLSTSSGKGSHIARIIPSIKPFIKEKYNLNFEYKTIKPSEAYKYVKNGYMVILGVENRDSLGLFTGKSHYIVLVGYDLTGNLMTVNTNLRTELFDSFAASRIRKNVLNSDFYLKNTVAFRYKYNDWYNSFDEERECKVVKKAELSSHYNGYGKVTGLKKNSKITILGERGSRYYVRYNNKTGFILKDKTEVYTQPLLSHSKYTYDGTTKVPTVDIRNHSGNSISTDEYRLTYPEQPVNPGRYRIDIEYLGDYDGPSYAEYTIVPPKTKINSVKSYEKSVMVKWNALPNDWCFTKYQLQYSTDKTFKKKVKTVKLDKNVTSKKIKKLESNTKYYFRIRAYKVKNGERLYSDYCATKSVKTKKNK